MRRWLLAAALVALAAPAAAQVPHDKSQAHATRTFHMVRAEVDYARPHDEGVLAFETDAWIGGDRQKLWLKSEGEFEDGDLHEARLEALYSRNVSTFWDLQVGVRHDVEPRSTSYLAAGVQGLAPYQFETEAFAYLSEEGDLGARFLQSLDVHLTQRMILEPEVEVELQTADVPERGLGAGFTEAEISAQLRYEITRKFAPYVTVGYARLLGETADIARSAGDETDETSIRAGLRVWF